MKKLSILLTLLLASKNIQAQRIGMGTASPNAALQINHKSATVGPGILLMDSTAAGPTYLRMGNLLNQYWDIVSYPSATASSSILGFRRQTGTELLTLRGDGNLGINNSNPIYRLDVGGSSNFNGRLRIKNNYAIETGADIVGKEVNAGLIGYNLFSTNALTFVGAGTDAGNRKAYFFTEGGTTIAGPLNVTSAYQANGNSGNTGQVLTSNGANTAPSWSNAAYGAAHRVAVKFNQTTTSTSGFVPIVSSYYAVGSGIGVDFTNDRLDINRTGLYHFDIGYSTEVIVSSNPASSYPRMRISLDVNNGLASNTYFVGETSVLSPTSDGRLAWNGASTSGIDIHITAGSIVRLTFGVAGTNIFNSTLDGTLTAHFIAD